MRGGGGEGLVMADPDKIVETHCKDVVGSLKVSRIHFQLRRMKKYSNYSDNVFLTAIPEYRSNVRFTFRKQALNNGLSAANGGFNATRSEQPQSDYFDDGTTAVEDLAGFIMFECGLEDINVQAACRDGYVGLTQSDGKTPASGGDVLGETKNEADDMSGTASTNVVSGGPVSPVVTPPGVSSPVLCSSPQSVYVFKDPSRNALHDVKLNLSSSQHRDHTAILMLSPDDDCIDIAPPGVQRRIDPDDISLQSETPSSCGNTADNEGSYGGSRASLSSEAEVPMESGKKKEDAAGVSKGDEKVETELQGDASSVSMIFRTAWFNFAAPPLSPKKRKLEYTRSGSSLTCL